MLAVRVQHRLPWTALLVALVLLVSSQHALRDPRTQILPVSFLPGADLCRSYAGSSPSSHSNHGTHTPQQHCPLCIIGGFSDGAVGPLVAVPMPNPLPLGISDLQQPQKLHLSSVFPLLNRGPPQVG
jgi:hypothetical protein